MNSFTNLVVRSGKSMSQIARESGVSLSHVSKVASGTRMPSLNVLAAIAEALEVDEQDVIDAIKRDAHDKAA